MMMILSFTLLAKLMPILYSTRRQKAIPWDAWAWERIRMNCEVKLIATINQLDRP